jgi:hypothetical protein
LPEEWLIERIQQVGATPCNLLSPSFSALCFAIAAIFRVLRYSLVTGARFAEFTSTSTTLTRRCAEYFSFGRTEGRLSRVQQQAKAARLLPREASSRCYRCGAEIPEFEFFEPFKSRLTELMNKRDRIQILKELREESGCEFSVAKQWVSHKTFRLPEATPCPHCGQPLRTARARQCRFCLRDWH